MSKRLPPAAGWALAGGLPKGPIGVEGKRGGESLFGWPLAWEFPVPLPTGKGQLQGLEPHVSPGSHTPNVHLAGRVSAFSTPQSTHTQPGPSKPTLARPYGRRRRLNNTCRLVSVQGPGAVGGLVARRSVASTYTWACDGRRTQQSQPDSDEHGNGLGEVGRWEGEERGG